MGFLTKRQGTGRGSGVVDVIRAREEPRARPATCVPSAPRARARGAADRVRAFVPDAALAAAQRLQTVCSALQIQAGAARRRAAGLRAAHSKSPVIAIAPGRTGIATTVAV